MVEKHRRLSQPINQTDVQPHDIVLAIMILKRKSLSQTCLVSCGFHRPSKIHRVAITKKILSTSLRSVDTIFFAITIQHVYLSTI